MRAKKKGKKPKTSVTSLGRVAQDWVSVRWPPDLNLEVNFVDKPFSNVRSVAEWREGTAVDRSEAEACQ